MEVTINKKVIIIIIFQLFTKSIFNEYSYKHYHHLMINDVVEVMLKVDFGIKI